ncbi:hypothetical protein B0H34DRAFT_675656 [Crassisporium funariophilum]|nr:hypothetical protein B0H34DRAFT_675656 [Crassisporium funariophilum]
MFDEVQGFCNIGAKHSAALELMKLTIFCLIMTATPLQTLTKCYRMPPAWADCSGYRIFCLRRRFKKRRMTPLYFVKCGKASEETDSYVPNTEPKECHIEIAQRMQTHFTNCILPHTGNSLNWKGEKLIDIPPYINIPVIVKLTARKMEIISKLADNVKDSVLSMNGVLQICSRSFYIDHQICVLYAQRNLAKPVPHFKTLKQWQEKKSTKFNICARLCRHLLTRDDAPKIKVVDGKILDLYGILKMSTLTTQAWSSQDKLQICGRVHCPPQKKVVCCYHILANKMADIILAALAHNKHHMMAGFLTQDRGKEMLTLLLGKNVADPQDDYDKTNPAYMQEGPSVVKAKSKKSKGKQNEEGGQQRKRGRNKSAAVVVNSNSNVPKDTPSVEAKKKGKKKA